MQDHVDSSLPTNKHKQTKNPIKGKVARKIGKLQTNVFFYSGLNMRGFFWLKFGREKFNVSFIGFPFSNHRVIDRLHLYWVSCQN